MRSSVLFCALWFALTACASTQEPTPEHPQPQTPRGQSESQDRRADGVASGQQVSASEAQGSAEHQQRNVPDDPQDWWITGSAIAQAFSALVVMVFTALLVWYNRRLLIATERAADAARSNADTAVQTLYLTQRARVGLQGMNIAQVVPGQRIPVDLLFRHYSGKPATLIDCTFKSETRSGPPPAEPVYGTTPPEWRPITHTMASGSTHTISYAINPLAAQDWIAIESGARRCLIYGRLRYNDGFGNTKTTRFVREYDRENSILRGTQVWSVPAYDGYGQED